MSTFVDKSNQPDDSIGVCWLEADGTIVLKLKAVGPDGIVGQGILRYSPDHSQYQDILDHVGPLAPDQTKTVAPWPD